MSEFKTIRAALEASLSIEHLKYIIDVFRKEKEINTKRDEDIKNWLIQKQVYFGWNQTYNFVLPDDAYPNIGCDICKVARKSENMYRNVDSKALICSNCLYTMGIYLEAHKRGKAILEILLDRLTDIGRSIGIEVNKMGGKKSAVIIRNYFIKMGLGNPQNTTFTPVVIDINEDEANISEFDASLMKEFNGEDYEH